MKYFGFVSNVTLHHCVLTLNSLKHIRHGDVVWHHRTSQPTLAQLMAKCVNDRKQKPARYILCSRTMMASIRKNRMQYKAVLVTKHVQWLSAYIQNYKTMLRNTIQQRHDMNSFINWVWYYFYHYQYIPLWFFFAVIGAVIVAGSVAFHCVFSLYRIYNACVNLRFTLCFL